MPPVQRRCLSFREKYSPFLTCLAIFTLFPAGFWLEKYIMPPRGYRATASGHHVKKLSYANIANAQKVWDYHLLHDKLKPADVIIVFCSHDLRVADHAVDLYKRKLSQRLVFSGGFGTGPHSGKNLHGWTQPEATIFAERALELGVPKEDIILEKESTNTAENVEFSQKVLKSMGIEPKTVIVVQKPFMERRAYATFRLAAESQLLQSQPQPRTTPDPKLVNFNINHPNPDLQKSLTRTLTLI